MRTTITLDDDLAKRLEKKRHLEGKSFKAVLNEALRDGLSQEAPAAPAETTRTRTFDLGKPTVENLDNIAEVLAIVEGEDHK